MTCELCCIGHITLDKVVNPSSTVHMPGGTAYYFSHAIRNMAIDYRLVTAVAPGELRFVNDLQHLGIPVSPVPTAKTVCFENIYGDDPDHRTQRVSQQADPFTVNGFPDIDAHVFHLGPLLAGDIPGNLIRHLNGKGKIALDIQGYLREVRDEQVFAVDWPEKHDLLPLVDFLKVNESELEVLSGESDIRRGAVRLQEMGVTEVVITLGGGGSLIYHDSLFYTIPAYRPPVAVDATGCGDTYMAGYLYKRIQGEGIESAGNFASAMAGLKIGVSGPFTGTETDVLERQHKG